MEKKSKRLWMRYPLALSLLLCTASLRADIVIIVNPNNPVETLTEREVKRIFLGRLRQFPSTNRAMDVLDQDAESPIYEKFYTEFIGFGLRKLRRYRAAYLFSGKGTLPQEVADHGAVKAKVLKNERAIGYIDATLVDDSVKVIYRWSHQDSQGIYNYLHYDLALNY